MYKSILLIGVSIFSMAHANELTLSQSPCSGSIKAFQNTYDKDIKFKLQVDAAFKNIHQLPPEYPDGNPWIGKSQTDLTLFLQDWCTFLPTMDKGHDNGLKYIEDFTFFYYQNPDAIKVVQQDPGRKILQDFVKERGAFMDSKASTVPIANWLDDKRIEKEDYTLPDSTVADGGFKSFNEFFIRTLKDQEKSRPQTMPERDYVISAPTDCIINSIPQKIVSEETRIPTKGRQTLNINEMLDGSSYAEKFIGGTALSCVLMPNTYHHYHAPVSGAVVESKIIEDPYYGYDNSPVWINTGNVGYNGTDFSQFENFKRGYFIIDTGKYGHVALIPVGLNTISSIVFNHKFIDIKKPVPVTRGDELGNFQYGGSLFIMIFEQNRYKSDAIQVRLGNQIGVFDSSQ